MERAIEPVSLDPVIIGSSHSRDKEMTSKQELLSYWLPYTSSETMIVTQAGNQLKWHLDAS